MWGWLKGGYGIGSFPSRLRRGVDASSRQGLSRRASTEKESGQSRGNAPRSFYSGSRALPRPPIPGVLPGRSAAFGETVSKEEACLG